MHEYATNVPGKHKLLFGVAFVAVFFASGIGMLMSMVADWTGVPVGSVSALAIFGGLWWWVDNKLWKHPWARRVMLVPDLNGCWHCSGRTVTQNGQPVQYEWDARIKITQSWTKMLVRLERPNGESMSTSISAALYNDGDEHYRLIYYYSNQPIPSEVELKRHSGLTTLNFRSGESQARGTYFTDGDRSTVGEMLLTRIGDDDGH